MRLFFNISIYFVNILFKLNLCTEWKKIDEYCIIQNWILVLTNAIPMHSFLHIYALVLNSPVRTIRTLRSCNSCSKFIYELWSAVTPCRPNSCCFASNSLRCVMKLKQNRNTQHTPLDYIYIGRPTTKKKNGKSHHTYFILMFALFFFILCCAVWCGFVSFDPRVCAVCTSECSSQVAQCSLIESEKKNGYHNHAAWRDKVAKLCQRVMKLFDEGTSVPLGAGHLSKSIPRRTVRAYAMQLYEPWP